MPFWAIFCLILFLKIFVRETKDCVFFLLFIIHRNWLMFFFLATFLLIFFSIYVPNFFFFFLLFFKNSFLFLVKSHIIKPKENIFRHWDMLWVMLCNEGKLIWCIKASIPWWLHLKNEEFLWSTETRVNRIRFLNFFYFILNSLIVEPLK